ncbi:cysteine desulfurase NifS [Defluviitalea raffinosedens]|jgi:cysteine desulfurase|uniref:Cysteine desulfurase IscS n=1 Tax=Defluviitalea raffinosedens TaxID=1450156 RepID=A0A7C8HD08_9FIRM|nr:cysteine desulfurase NifS [Defluviitalea raffinosedens]KAE9628447.1 cysteine desulfurase NifS [Defluviitalea raffinosedens]MBM7686878.1 cysteine desulfurase [Defluviitalea raffinosedens]MBZ4668120.1 cysteine desulfurase NifS [Defluviitaleaceae bacterium]
MQKIYFDHAATTAMHPQVVEAMLPYFTENFGNPSSIYEIARKNKQALDESRDKIAKLLGADPKEIYFTSGGTESDNWAIKGIAEAYKNKGNHIITSAIEHHAVLHTCEYLESQGYEVTYLPVNEYGQVDPQDVLKAIKDTTILITIMYANNEIGTIQPIEEIGKIAREKGIVFHTDAVQAVGHIPIDVKKANVDLLSLSGHKFHGPKGVGVLYIRKGVKIKPLLHGGAQERGRRGGTENVAGIVGLAKALELALENMEENNKKMTELRDYIIKEVTSRIDHVKLNGHPTDRLPNNINFTFDFIEGESLLLLLDMKGIYASSGSACTSGSLDPSHVLLAIGLPHEKAHGSLRITLGDENTKEEADYFLEVLPSIVQRLRDMSPLYEAYKKEQNL